MGSAGLSAVVSQLVGMICSGTTPPAVVRVNSFSCAPPVSSCSSTVIGTRCPAVSETPLALAQFSELGDRTS